MRILGDQKLYPTDKLNEEFDQLVSAQEKVFLILSPEAVFKFAKDVVQQYSSEK